VPPGEVYYIQDQLGRGSHAKVFLAEPKYPEPSPEEPSLVEGPGASSKPQQPQHNHYREQEEEKGADIGKSVKHSRRENSQVNES
jgi:hypothetical protein